MFGQAETWVAVAFVLFVALLIYLKVPAKVAAMLDERSARIAKELAEAKRLRESNEEVGLDPDVAGVRIVGLLDALWIPVSDFAVTPVVAVAPGRPQLVPSPAEVVRIIEPPLATFLPDAPLVTVERMIRGWPVRYGHYEVDGLSVWGATARILSQLGAVIAEGGSSPR